LFHFDEEAQRPPFGSTGVSEVDNRQAVVLLSAPVRLESRQGAEGEALADERHLEFVLDLARFLIGEGDGIDFGQQLLQFRHRLLHRQQRIVVIGGNLLDESQGITRAPKARPRGTDAHLVLPNEGHPPLPAAGRRGVAGPEQSAMEMWSILPLVVLALRAYGDDAICLGIPITLRIDCNLALPREQGLACMWAIDQLVDVHGTGCQPNAHCNNKGGIAHG
jgi:hypothetical protein